MSSEFCAGHPGPQTHVELSVYNDISSSVEVICGNAAPVGARCSVREGTSSYAEICTEETRSFRSVMSAAKHFRARTATGCEITTLYIRYSADVPARTPPFIGLRG